METLISLISLARLASLVFSPGTLPKHKKLLVSLISEGAIKNK